MRHKHTELHIYTPCTPPDTHTERQNKKAKQSLWKPCETQLLPPSEPALGNLYTTQALKASAGKSFWDRASNPQEDCPSLTDRIHGPKVPQQFHTTK